MSNGEKAMTVPAPTADNSSTAMMANVGPNLTSVEGAMSQMAMLMKSMADTIRSMNDRVSGLEKELRQMAPVTSSQADAIGRAIRDRALELADHAGLAAHPEALREIGSLIRKDLRLASGIRSVKELPRVEYLVALERIGYWDDYKQMKALRGKYAQREGINHDTGK